MKIDIRGSRVLYVTIGDWTYYIDDSTGEQIVQVFANRQLFYHNKKQKQSYEPNNRSQSKSRS
jgi:hypothetical protein